MKIITVKNAEKTAAVQQDMLRAVSAVLAGDKDEFDVIYKRFRPFIGMLAVSYLRRDSRIYVQDAIADIFLKIYANLDKYSPEYTFSTWVGTIAKNHLCDMVRQYAGRQFEPHMEDMPSSDSIHSSFERRDLVGQVKSAISKMKPIYAESLLMRYFDGNTYDEMSSMLQIKLSTSKGRVHRGRKRFIETKLIQELIQELKDN